ncbi:MAG: hypothetical protein ABIT71_02270 [Vicinamibacteraceae bacterium]
MEVVSPWTAMAFAWMPMFLVYALFYLVFCVPPLLLLRGRTLDDMTRAVWALAIISVPIMGAVAFVILQPGQSHGEG